MNDETLRRALDAIKKQYGEGSVRTGDEYDNPTRISTGALELDLALNGGVPLGRWSHWYGGHYSGKTMMALQAIGNAQKMGLSAAYYNIEKQFTTDWAEKHGVNTKELILIENTKIEEIGAIMETLLGSVNIHVLDSIPAAVSVDELSANTEDWRPGISARAWGKALRRANTAFSEKENAIIMINHVGVVFGKYAGGEEPKGGRILEYLSSCSIEFRRSSWLFRDKSGNLKSGDGLSEESLSGDKEPGGIEFATRTKKSRVSRPHATARLRLDFRTGQIDDMWSIVKAAEHYGIVSKGGSWYTLPDGKSKVQGEAGLRAHIESNPDLREKIIGKMKEVA